MVAYGFQSRFIAAILAGEKRQTVRGARRRHARAGETIQLYFGLRTKQCRLIGRARCVSIDPVRLNFEPGSDPPLLIGEERPMAPDAFARADGFTDFAEMGQFWRDRHGVARFTGFVIRWADFVF